MGLFVLLHFFIICEFFVFHFSDVKITEVPSPLLFLVVNTTHRDFVRNKTVIKLLLMEMITIFLCAWIFCGVGNYQTTLWSL